MKRVLPGVLTGAALLALFQIGRPESLGAQAADTTLLQRLLVAEDARGKGAIGIAPLLEGAAHADVRVRRVAVRGLGRLQQATAATLTPLAGALAGPVAVLRSEAANALAQRVQGLPRDRSAGGADAGPAVRETQDLLLAAMARETDASVAGVLARSLGRLPFADAVPARQAERATREMVARLGGVSGAPTAGVFGRLPATAVHDLTEGLYALARARRTLGDVSSDARDLLAAALGYRSDARVRRMAAMALTSAGAFDSTLVLAAYRDPDAQVRRLALAGISVLSATTRANVVRTALVDSVPMVRVDALRAARVGVALPDCAPMIAATRDADPHVMLAAIDALSLACADPSARTAALRTIAGSLDKLSTPTGGGVRAVTSPRSNWHAPTRALVALARTDAATAAPLLAVFAVHGNPHVREYAARAAALLKDAGTLRQLAGDSTHNVQDAAITGLTQVVGHGADGLYVTALASPGYQVVMAAAGALAGSTNAAAAPALLDAFDRLSAEQRENSRDARVAVLTRLGELGAPLDAPRLERYSSDFDTTIAAKAAGILSKWTGRTVAPQAAPLALRAEPLAAFAAAPDLQLRITMSPASGGGTILVRLFSDEAPATVARLVRLARAGYFNGLTFHRIATNFVLQGGSPDATEFVGDGPFMRDELGLRSHDRGTLGISTRGRDTGDAQFYINVVDNPRLDHDYTVFGEIVAGMAVADHIIEGDVMARVEILGRNVSRPE